ncbi:MAG: helix-turn-helix domain-containing protein [Actinomycetota bacterium]
MGRNPTLNAQQRAETRRQLVDTGRRLFAERGFDRTTVGAIAEEAGCSKGLVYHYFPTKQALAEAALEAWLATVGQLAASVADIEDPAERLAAFARAMAAFVADHPDDYRLNLRSLTDPSLRDVAAQQVDDRLGPEHPWGAAFERLGSSVPHLDGRLFQASLLGIFAHHVLSPVPTDVAALVDRLIHHHLEQPWPSS